MNLITPGEIGYLGLIGAVAFLYSAVGHAGASGYFAVLSLAGWAPAEIRPLALILNVMVAAVASTKFIQRGHFRFSLFWPFACLSIPAAAFGGYLELPSVIFSAFIGLILCFSAIWLLIRKREPEVVKPPSLTVALVTGGIVGFVSGLSGTGGGIFLSPLMLFLRWGKTKTIAAVAAPFILFNSLAGLVGLSFNALALSSETFPYIAVALFGGLSGSHLGSGSLSPRVIQLFLAAVLLIAGAKLTFLMH